MVSCLIMAYTKWFCSEFEFSRLSLSLFKVAMLGGMGSTIQRDLTRIAETADTSTREGVSYLLTGSFMNCL